uniref:Uncharacterized protein n=1 Tax=Opuntia streptacantha TaxID=393608 RepID=A0A7C9EI53_OPUST
MRQVLLFLTCYCLATRRDGNMIRQLSWCLEKVMWGCTREKFVHLCSYLKNLQRPQTPLTVRSCPFTLWKLHMVVTGKRGERKKRKQKLAFYASHVQLAIIQFVAPKIIGVGEVSGQLHRIDSLF